ncbi:MFS transporter [Alkalilimnicola ehrlichii]|uniref:MFS transporter n=1 Tax=Alkalilimnicola ehrlichii TaxID=351052 RepID=UPI001C6F4CF2|nr:MFS transporter [Alkalilimnicola ehrlichii]
MLTSLLKTRRFAPFFWTQFFGALNDNLFKNALIILIVFQGAQWSAADSNVMVNVAAGLFILPFLVLSPLAGQLADKLEKSRWIRLIKVGEIAIMGLAVLGLLLQSLWLLFAVLFLLGVQSSLFGPVKYSILPQHLRSKELVAGNGLVEMGTFVAILIGTLLGGLLVGSGNQGPTWVAISVTLFALLGYATARRIPKASAAAPHLKLNWNLPAELARSIGFIRRQRSVMLAVIGIAWFWFLGAVLLTQFPNFTNDVLRGNEYVAVSC